MISVVIPSYNPPKLLFKQCIESIISQSYSDYEIIVVDDGSKDENAAFMDEIALLDERIHVIHQKNGGEGAARNTGLSHANGDYIMFIDADDCMGEEWLFTAIKIANETNADIIAGKVIICDKLSKNKNNDNLSYRYFSKDQMFQIQHDMLMGSTNILESIEYLDVGACAKLYKASLIEDEKFPVGVKLSADQVFNHQILYKCNSYVISDYISYYYIMNPSSISHIHNKDAVDIMMGSLASVEKYLYNNDLVRRAFYYHVIDDFQKALQFAYFNSTSQKMTIVSRYLGVKNSLKNELVSRALCSVSSKNYSSKIDYLKILLLKYKLAFSYVVMKILYLKTKK